MRSRAYAALVELVEAHEAARAVAEDDPSSVPELLPRPAGVGCQVEVRLAEAARNLGQLEPVDVAVEAAEDHIRPRDRRDGLLIRQPAVHPVDERVRVDGLHRALRDVHLLGAQLDVRGHGPDQAVQARVRDHVEVDRRGVSHAREGQLLSYGGAEASAAHDRHLGGGKLPLPLLAKQGFVATVPVRSHARFSLSAMSS
jgi:hypothetical protein